MPPLSQKQRAADPLLQPFQLKHLRLKNRIMSTAHEPNYAEDGMPTERYRRYHAEKARGGMAMTMTAGSAVVSADSTPSFGNLHAYRDEITPHLRRLAESCHEHECAVMIQLTHLGRRTSSFAGDWLPVLAPSSIREPAHRAFPKEMEDWDIDRVVADYAAAAARMKDAGLDGIEIECYGHLLDGFWSPATNRRTDEFGGSLENRMRFSLRVFEAIHEAVGPDFIVGARMVADEQLENGIDKIEGVEIAQRLIATGHVDFLNLIRGHIEHDAHLANVIPVTGMASAPHLDFAGEVRAATGFPVFHAAKISDVATARHAVASGKLDMVGMTRAHIADPHIVAKIEAGDEDRIRPCVGATYCLDRIYEGRDALCIHNAATSREGTLPHRIDRAQTRRRVVVAGAGPAGLEAARVAAERGHEVTVFEAAAEAGGQARLMVQARRRAEMIGIVEWRLAELERLGVDIRYNIYAEAEDALSLNPDIVVVATGGVPNISIIPEGNELAISTWDLLSGAVRPEGSVLIYDDNGAHPAMTAAEAVADAGAALELVSPERFFAPEIGGLNMVPYMKTLHNAGAKITTMARVASLRRSGNQIEVSLISAYGDAPLGERLVDHVAVEHGVEPLADLYHALKDRSANRGVVDYEALRDGRPQTRPDQGFQLFRIGDAVASRNIHASIHDALRLCKDL